MLKAIFLFPLSFIYKLAVGFRNFLFDVNIIKHTEFDTPIISIGNITVGGTGKTPHVEYLISFLKKKYKIAVLSRGYKRKTKGFILADSNSTFIDIGDEPFQIKQKFPDVLLAVSESRVKGVKKILEMDSEIDFILLDDAYQHRYIKPGLSILLVDFNRPFLEDHYLPYGSLRENPKNKNRANIIVVTKTPKDIKPIDMRIISKNLELFPYQSLYFSSLKYKNIEAVFNDKPYVVDFESIKKNKYHILVITGIASPESFYKYIETFDTEYSTIKFPDHHDYKEKDILKIVSKFNEIKLEKKIILTTEKDAIKLRALNFKDKDIKQKMFYIPIEVVIFNNDESEFKSKVEMYINKDKTQHKYHIANRKYYS